MPALEGLTPEQFEWAMSLVHARYPGLPTGPGEEMQFDITCLDSLALRQLMDLTQACATAAKVCHAAPVMHLACTCCRFLRNRRKCHERKEKLCVCDLG